ncbi:hypothetical protein SKAU_G00321210 [Synaphobranchus kaupii]|uniref:Uncharacterized protein n=1 Tax=Synaphobranchus kaupii TaxID=118154 RepID=A0A9Q1IHM9_SYNKA|nr:hypothetical protein SKAU_G00321210 [Synaphobranchus kaupii]
MILLQMNGIICACRHPSEPLYSKRYSAALSPRTSQAGGLFLKPLPPAPPPKLSLLIGLYTMSSGPAQDVVVENFLRDIERRGEQLHCTVIGQEGSRPHAGMNLLYRKSRLEWRNRGLRRREEGVSEEEEERKSEACTR